MAQYELNLRDYWRILRKRKTIIILTALLSGSFTFALSYINKPRPIYIATSQVKIEQSNKSAAGFFYYSTGDTMATQANIIRSYPVMKKVAQRLGIITEEDGYNFEDMQISEDILRIISELQGKVGTAQVGRTNIIEITATSFDPVEAQKIANVVADEFRKISFYSKNKQIHEARKFVEGQLDITGDKLRDAEEDLREFKEKNKIALLAEETRYSMRRLIQVEDEYNKIKNIKQEIVSQIATVKKGGSLVKKATPRIFTEKGLTVIYRLNNNLLDLQLKRDNLLLNYREEHPLVKEVDTKIANICDELLRELNAKLKVYKTREERLKSEYVKLKSQNRQLPQKALALGRLVREVKINEELFAQLKGRYQEISIKESEKIEEVTIVKPAMKPMVPINTPKTVNKTIVGSIIGLMLGLVLSFIFESLDTSIGAIEDVERLIKLPVMGVIPFIETKKYKSTVLKKIKNVEKDLVDVYAQLVTHLTPLSPLAESYRSLRSSVLFAAKEHDIKTLTLTSTSAMEGKTTTTINLAITFAQLGRRVLLIDADLRKPAIHHVFGLEKTPGLSEILIGTANWEDVVQTTADLMLGNLGLDLVLSTPGFDNISIITCGTCPPNPSEFLNSKRMEEQIKLWKANYDLVIFDAPPTLPVTDSVVLSSKTDGVLIIYKVGKIASSALKRTKFLLDNAQARILGVVLNAIKAEVSPDFQHLGYHLYHYYGEDNRFSKYNKKQ